MEYGKFAKYYDKLYCKKDYQKEVYFIEQVINQKSSILDLGCGTGIHAKLLEKDGYCVDGLDKSVDMLNVAKTKIKGNVYNQNLLEIKLNKTYDVIISMFAVVNHLHNLEELNILFKELYGLLNENGIILIDLHNPIKSGEKIDILDDITRKMVWNFNSKTMIEKTQITYFTNNKKFIDTHIFKIFTIDDIKNIAIKNNFKVVNIYENYDINKKANSFSKNIQFVIKKK